MKRYIAIDLISLRENNLSLEEWTLLENIYFMSNNEFGWCYASKDTLRDIIQVSNGQIYKIIKRLLENDFLVKNIETGYLKVTQKWINISSGNSNTNSNIENDNLGCGDPLQKMENESPKNGIDPLQKMETKIDNTKRDIKVDKEKDKKENSVKTEYQKKLEKYPLLKDILKRDDFEDYPDYLVVNFIEYRKQIKKPVKTIAPILAFCDSLRKLIQLGYDEDFCIEQMKSSEWQTIKVEYIHKPTKYINEPYMTKTDRRNKFVDDYFDDLYIEDAEVLQ